jgi:signal transduction histidine kinase
MIGRSGKCRSSLWAGSSRVFVECGRFHRYAPLMPYRSIEDPVKLRRVLDATLLLAADLELPELLRHVIEEACSLTGARYGALGVLNDDRTGLVEFITFGLDAQAEATIGARPTGRGVLGLFIDNPQPLRLARLGSHPESYGFPSNHPPMTSYLGVPIKVRDEVYGNLYLTDKTGAPEFTDDDEGLVAALALAAGIAIENTRLHSRVQQVAVFEDRDRMARDLHDTVIQHLFAVGLSLQSMAGEVDAGLASRLVSVIANIDDVIRQVRSSIYELGLGGDDRGVRATVLALIRSLDPVVGFEVRVLFDGPVDTAVNRSVEEHLLATVREAVTNIGRHANATAASVSVRVEGAICRLEVTDNGDGIRGGPVTAGGRGLINLRRRAENLGGELLVKGAPGGGTVLIWSVPIAP